MIVSIRKPEGRERARLMWGAAVHGVTKRRTRLSDFTSTLHFHALDKEMATHSSVLAWRIPGTGKPGGLSSMGSHRVGHDWSDLAAAAATRTLGPQEGLCLQLCPSFSGRPTLSKLFYTYVNGELKTTSIAWRYIFTDPLPAIQSQIYILGRANVINLLWSAHPGQSSVPAHK